MFKTPLQAQEFAADVLQDPSTEVDAPPCADEPQALNLERPAPPLLK
jgi:hypothetical protein